MLANLWCMNETQRKQFAERLLEICPDLQVPFGRGREAALARVSGLSPNAVRKWLHGEGMPELDRAILLANKAKVSVLWLLQGIGPKRVEHRRPAAAEGVAEALDALPPEARSEILDFVRYKLERLAPLSVQERIAPYLHD